MKRFAIALAFAAVVSEARAHPMGNFSVNRYALLEPSPERLRLTYIVDFAEIPTYQEISAYPELTALRDPEALRTTAASRALLERLADRWASQLRVHAGAVSLPMRIRTRDLRFAPGAGGLPTMKLSLRLDSRWPAVAAAAVRYEDRNAPDRIGWREVVLRPGTGIGIRRSDTGSADRSEALTRYPSDPTADVPSAVTASFEASGLRRPASPPPAEARLPEIRPAAPRVESAPLREPLPAAAPLRRRDALADLVAAHRLTPGLLLLSLATAFALGGLHALSPGHGKTVVAAYLVGARGTAKHALLLGAVVTVSHTIGVFALGFVTLALSRAIVPERLYPAIELLSGVAIVAVAVAMFLRRLRAGPGRAPDHSHAVEVPESAPTASALLALGVSGGILPCPSALVVLLSAIALHRVGFGLLLITGFSAGLAAALSGVGILVVRAGALVSRFAPDRRWTRRLPAFSALLIGVLGLVLAARALPEAARAFLGR